jgi:hypothetical protein
MTRLPERRHHGLKYFIYGKLRDLEESKDKKVRVIKCNICKNTSTVQGNDNTRQYCSTCKKFTDQTTIKTVKSYKDLEK